MPVQASGVPFFHDVRDFILEFQHLLDDCLWLFVLNLFVDDLEKREL